MADFELELQLTARIDDLEKGMKDAQRAVEKSSEKMETATKDAAEGGVKPLIDKIAKVAATLFLAEAAFKVGGAAIRGMAGDTEGMIAALKSIPIIGPLATSIFDFADALKYAGEEATDTREEILELSIALQRMQKQIAARETRVSDMAELARLQGKTEEQIATARLNVKFLTIRQESELEKKAAEDTFKARKQEIKDSHLAQAESFALQVDAMEDHQKELERIKAKAALRTQITTLQQQEQIKIAETKRLEEVAKRKEELNKQAEDHHATMMELEEEAKKKESERLEIEKEKAKELEKHLELVKKISNAEQEVAKARADASKRVSQATASFSTAGGSFTTGASAELNEAKLLTKISTASKELLAEIVRNTAGIGAGLV